MTHYLHGGDNHGQFNGFTALGKTIGAWGLPLSQRLLGAGWLGVASAALRLPAEQVDAGDGVAVQVDRQDQGTQDQQPRLVRRQPPPEQHGLGGGGGDRAGAAPGQNRFAPGSHRVHTGDDRTEETVLRFGRFASLEPAILGLHQICTMFIMVCQSLCLVWLSKKYFFGENTSLIKMQTQSKLFTNFFILNKPRANKHKLFEECLSDTNHFWD
jgi:hypothetical protein